MELTQEHFDLQMAALNTKMENVVTKDEAKQFASRADLVSIESRMATKEDLVSIESRMATKEDIASIESRMATKEDLVSIESRMATKEDLVSIESRMATKEDLKGFATKEDIKGFASKNDLKTMETTLISHMEKYVGEVSTSILDAVDSGFNRLEKRILGIDYRLSNLEADMPGIRKYKIRTFNHKEPPLISKTA